MLSLNNVWLYRGKSKGKSKRAWKCYLDGDWMHLNEAELDRFLTLFSGLVDYVNEAVGVTEQTLSSTADDFDFEEHLSEVLEYLWNDVGFIDQYIDSNITKLSLSQRQTLKEWKQAVGGAFVVVKHEGGYGYFMKDQRVYKVKGIFQELSQTIGRVPCRVEATLLPFEGSIVHDTMIRQFSDEYTEGQKPMLLEELDRLESLGYVYSSSLVLMKNAEYHRAEEHNRMLDKQLDDYLRKSRQANPQSVMPEGMHLGQLAGMQFAERNAYVEKTLKADEKRRLNEILGQALAAGKKSIPTWPPPAKLEKVMGFLYKDDLVGLAGLMGIPHAAQMKKAELIQELTAVSRQFKDLLEIYMVNCSDEEFDVFHQLAENDGKLVQAVHEVDTAVLELQLSPILTLYADGNDLVLHVATEFFKTYREIDFKEISRERRRVIRIKECLDTCMAFYGIMSFNDFRERYYQFYPNDIYNYDDVLFETEDLILYDNVIYDTWADSVSYDDYLDDSDLLQSKQYIVHPALLEKAEAEGLGSENSKSSANAFIKQLIHKRKKSTPRHIDKKATKGFDLFDYCCTAPEVLSLVQFLDTFIPDGMNDLTFAETMTSAIIENAQLGADPSVAINMLTDVGFVLDNPDMLSDLSQLLYEAVANLPMWELYGHSLRESDSLGEAQKQQTRTIHEGIGAKKG
ncbi:MAG: hypothetical protein FWH40_06375 [Coriobacteriia bacterium]|nr:hypothetical protein [Coriobacteriia bacterium]MCL2137128.1 hypothetical protein [Coriobacteriia bacterium]